MNNKITNSISSSTLCSICCTYIIAYVFKNFNRNCAVILNKKEVLILPEKWTGELVGRMHINCITIKELAQHMGIRLEYASMVLNGKRSPAGDEDRFHQALDELIAARERADSQKG